MKSGGFCLAVVLIEPLILVAVSVPGPDDDKINAGRLYFLKVDVSLSHRHIDAFISHYCSSLSFLS